MADGSTTITSRAVESLVFDPENPRLPSTIDGNNEEEVLRWMLRDGALIELMGSIGEKGYFHGEDSVLKCVGEEERGEICQEGKSLHLRA